MRLLDSLIGADMKPNVYVHLDDILIVSETFRGHQEWISRLIHRLQGMAS